MNKHFEYKGYLGSIEADVEEGFLFGRLAFIRDIVSYREDDVPSLKIAFEAAVDEYLSTCGELGHAPELPCKGTFNVRVGPELHQRIALVAAKADVSLNDWIKAACTSSLESESVRNAISDRPTAKIIESYEETETVREVFWEQEKTTFQSVKH